MSDQFIKTTRATATTYYYQLPMLGQQQSSISYTRKGATLGMLKGLKTTLLKRISYILFRAVAAMLEPAIAMFKFT